MTPRRTHPGGIPTTASDEQYTPTPVLVREPAQPVVGSRTFVAIVSTILGIIVSVTTIQAFTGKYFFVDRTEYSEKSLRESEERGKLQGLLGKIEATLSQQTTALSRAESKIDDLSESLRKLEIKIAERR